MKRDPTRARRLARYRELTRPGRILNLFEQVELEALERALGQLMLPFATPKK